MIAKYKKKYHMNTRMNKHFEKVSDNLILVNLFFEIDGFQFTSRPIHKIYEFGDFPPLDISFDSDTGLFKEITLFIKKTSVSDYCNIKKSDLHTEEGYPCFGFDMLKKHQYYYDEVCQIEVSLCESVLCVLKRENAVEKKIIINSEFSILLKKQDEFVGFLLNGLSNNEVQLLKK